MTVAHEIKYPWKNKHGYRDSIITIWHVDPEKNSLGCRGDDSCGWFSPSYTKIQLEEIVKLAQRQYQELFPKTVAYAEKKDFAYITYNQDCYGAIYWSWRALKAMNKKGWQYGKPLTLKELDEIYKLSTNPVDNFQWHFRGEISADKFQDFFLLIWRCFRKFYRPWYRHPRWHIRHWRIQFRPWQAFYRRYFEKCSVCGKKGFKGSAIGDWDGTKVWHDHCDGSRKQPMPINNP